MIFNEGWKKVVAGHYVLHHHKGYTAMVTRRRHAAWYAEVTSSSGETISKDFYNQRAGNATMGNARAWAFRQMARIESGLTARLKWHKIEEILS